MHIVKEKRFYINLLTITIPIALQNLISFATSMMDTIMLGRADDTGVFLSASSLANQPFFILSLVCFGLAGASTVLSAQYWGKRDTASIRSIYSIILKVAFVISTLMALAVLIFPQAVMGIYSNNDEIIAARKSSPLVVGIGEGEYFLASDATPIVEYVKDVVYLNDGEIAVICCGKYYIVLYKRIFELGAYFR